jgi:hypothetical protein
LIKALKKYSCIDFNFVSSGSEVTKLWFYILSTF